MSENRKQVIRQAKEMYPEKFAEMEEGLQETLKELVQPIEGEDKAHTTHEKIVAELEAESNQRLKMLKRVNKDRVSNNNPCPFCGSSAEVAMVEGWGKYIDNHTDDCELDTCVKLDTN